MSSLSTTYNYYPAVQRIADTDLHILGRPVSVTLTKRARKALNDREDCLWIEMELYFSCLVRKMVRFYETEPDHQAIMDPVKLTDKVRILFRPVVTEHCAVADVADAPPLDTMPVEKPEAMVPKWLTIDYRNSQWCGEFGY